MATWPPTLDELKTDLTKDLADIRDDARLTLDLDAAVAFVQRVKSGYQFDATDPAQINLPEPPADMRLGTLRLAGRWGTRRRSPDGMLAMADLGAARVTSYDPDIDRLLRIGKYAPAVFA